jgi:hypothetical protein
MHAHKKAMFGAILAGLLTVAPLAHSQDTDRIEQLEREVQSLKQRLTKIEAAMGGPRAEQVPAATGTGWMSVAAWRQLRTDMSPNQVRTILGEPARIDGGVVARWSYPNGGRATFVGDQLSQWTEPN